MLGPSQYPVTISAFPRLGVSQRFTTPDSPFPLPENDGEALASWLCSRQLRYIQLKDQIVARRGRQTEAYIPKSRAEITSSNLTRDQDEFIRLEGVAHGPGCCAIQTTFQAPTEREARWLHDQLICLGPALLALTASTPMHSGYLVDRDCRWDSLADALDDRQLTRATKCAEGHECADASTPHRFSSNQVFISQDRPSSIPHTCSQLYVDLGVKARLMHGGMDELLATHFAYILSRDPLFLTHSDVSEHSDPDAMQDFAAFQGVWQHVHLKLPDGDNGGWRVEFRPMEVQLRDSDNAAFSIFMYLVSRAIVTYHLCFYIPLDLVSQSMHHAQKRNAVVDGLIWFRRQGWASQSFTCFACDDQGGCVQCKHPPAFDKMEFGLLSLDQIINGEPAGGFPGLVNIVLSFLRRQNIGENQLSRLSTYLDIVRQRANGSIQTPARWMRSFVSAHPKYQGDGRISESVCHDMMVEIAAMNE